MNGEESNRKSKDIIRAENELKRGSAEAFKILYRKYHKQTYRFCLRMLKDKDIAQDAFQETFIKVYENRKQFKGDNFSSWLFAIARNTCLNLIRRRKEFDSFEEFNYLPNNQKQSDVGLKDQVAKAISTLPLPFREALLLREYEEHSYKDIAEILGISLSLAKVRVHRAREILRKLLLPIKRELYES